MTYDYDLLVIGAGPGGLSAAKRAAKYGAHVAIAERANLGGVCVNQGCIPKKLMVYASDSAQLVENLECYGWHIGEHSFDWKSFMATLHQEVKRLQDVQKRSLTDAGIEIIKGHAKFLDPHKLEIADRKVTADKILIAVGGKPIRPKAIAGIEHALISDDMFSLEELPKKLVIIGGGYIGVEFASILTGLGAQVTLMNQDQGILNGFDDDLRHAVEQGLADRGISIFSETTTKSIEPTSDGLRLTLTGGSSETLLVDAVLCATGRKPNLENMGLDQAGVEVKDGAIAVDRQSRTAQPNIFAVGECINRVPLTPVARAEGRAFADLVFGDRSTDIDYDLVPSAVFSRPEAATVGMSESKARETLEDEIYCCQTKFEPLFHTLSKRSQQMLIKLVINRRSDQVLGVHIVGEDAAEIVQSLTPAIQRGVTKEALQNTIGIHPSSGEELFVME